MALPVGYKWLEYIQSSGTQYIDTGFKPNNNTRIVVKAVLSTPHSIYGVNRSGADFNMTGNGDGMYFYWGGGGHTAITNYYNQVHVFEQDKNICRVDGALYYTYPDGTWQAPCNMFLFGRNNGSSLNDSGTCRIYSCQIYDNGTLIRDYIPCQTPTGQVGLYDLVTDTLYVNKGTGVFICGRPRNLPSNYTALYYIESNGTQYIDTGYIPNQDTRVYAECVLPISTSSTQGLFGSRLSSSSSQQYQFVTQGGYYRTDYYNALKSMSSTSYGTNKFFIDKNKNVTNLNGDLTHTHEYGTFTCPGNMYIFATNNNGSVYARSTMKLYTMQIYDNDALVRDFVPCKNPSGEVGLYDLVESKFYGNNGTGSFIAGRPIGLPYGYIDLKYIESTGTQYIDTGYIPNQDTRVMAEMMYVSYSDATCGLFGQRTPGGAKQFELMYLSGRYYFSYGSNQYSTTASSPVGKRMFIDLSKTSATISVDGTVANVTPTTAETFIGFTTLKIHTLDRNGVNYLSNSRIYSFKIYENGALVRDFVPCKNASGTVGLYDLVNDKFYTNAGSGVFNGGTEVIGIKNIRSRARVSATLYNIGRGKTLIDSTQYYIHKGKTLINGTVYDIPIADWPDDLHTGLEFISANPFTISVSRRGWGMMEYCNGHGWKTWNGSEIASGEYLGGHCIYIRGRGNTRVTGSTSMDYAWTLNGTGIECNGNIENLLNYTTVAAGNHPPMSTQCFAFMFDNCSGLTKAPSLPATTLTTGCYHRMFGYCTNLTQAPVLPATTLADNCYANMFIVCKSLTKAPALPATTLANSCYSGMFGSCSNLTVAPSLPATTLADHCYNSMFNSCTSLTTAPSLPATTLAYGCYSSMFTGCSNLTTAPSLPATTLTESCYQNMFSNCRKLTAIPKLPATTLTEGCYSRMFYSCSAIMISTTQGGSYTQSYRIPYTGTGTTATDAMTNMFSNIGTGYVTTPSINTTYYVSTSNTIV